MCIYTHLLTRPIVSRGYSQKLKIYNSIQILQRSRGLGADLRLILHSYPLFEYPLR